jgi:hypothetical protein
MKACRTPCEAGSLTTDTPATPDALPVSERRCVVCRAPLASPRARSCSSRCRTILSRSRRLADLSARLGRAEAALHQAGEAVAQLRELVGLGIYRVAP